MYLVTVDAEHGVVAAPRSEDDRNDATEAALVDLGFLWNDDIEAYVHQTAADRATAVHTGMLLVALRHTVRTV